MPHPNHAPCDAMLTLAIPTALEEDVLDFLLLHPAWATGFSVLEAQGMGQGAPFPSSMEQVRGRGRRKLVMIAGVDADLRLLVQALAVALPQPDIAYWISPLLCHGRLA
ncbi:DUF3240 family protein [Janthinobacterium lividum]|uniref:DUF3240 domain-containing protein n=1 Tax=Janthinobacterium lividum TaxID=29581 RepID=A0A1E8PM78_9BURK|nr:hypothetical protein BA896_019060 [Janthinobacterium lividum]